MKIFNLYYIVFLIGFSLPSVHQTQAQRHKIDSLENTLTILPEDTNRVKTLNQLSWEYGRVAPKNSKLYAEKALTLAQKLNYTAGIASGHNYLGRYYWTQNQNDSAIIHYSEALSYFEKTGKEKSIASIYGNLALVYKDLGNYPVAIEYSLKSRQIAEKIGEIAIVGTSLNNIANVYKTQKQYTQALEYYTQAYQIFEKTNPINAAIILGNIGDIHKLLKQYDKAISSFQQAIPLLESAKDAKGLANAYNNLASTYFVLNQYKESAKYFTKALETAQEAGFNNSAAEAMQGLASIHLANDETEKAINLYEQSVALAEKNNIKENALSGYEALAKVYARQGNYTKAYDYLHKQMALRDSLFNSENTRKIAQLQAGYEVQKKQAEIELLQKDKEREVLQRNAIGTGLLATLIIGVLIVSRQRLKIRQNRLLIAKSEEVKLKNEQLQSQAQVLEKQAYELSLQTEKLRELDHIKSTFFANISHEFRTPLTIILSSLTDKLSLLKGSTGQKHVSIPSNEIGMMHRNAKRLLELINQLLDLSRIESGKMKLQQVPGNFTEFIRALAFSFHSIAEYRNIQYQVLLPENPLYFSFDADKLEKIITNLLSNAFKFTPDGGTISLKAEVLASQERDKSWLKVSVQDSGIGIPAEGLEKVFERFYQGTHYYSDQQGTGIGLALTKELVDLHGGNILAESVAGQGANFVVQLPVVVLSELPGEILPSAVKLNPDNTIADTDFALAFSEKGTEDKPGFTTPESVFTGKESTLPLILVVEDNEDLRGYIRNKLNSSYRVMESENGMQGLHKALDTLPDLIITDLMMPDMDGMQLCQQLKTDQRTSHIPVIMLTALATEESKLKGLETGADDYLTKPFDARELEVRIKNLIENRRLMREKFARRIQLEPTEITVSSAEERFLQKAMKVVEENISDADFNPEQFSREIGMSRMQLHRKLTALTGQTTGDFIKTLRMKRAAQLLDARSGNVSEIAYQVGFTNLSYFSKCFREEFNMSPVEYLARQEADTENSQ